MAKLTIAEVIELGDISNPLAANYQANGNIFGPRKAVSAPQTIALVTDALRWQWEAFPNVPEVRATATITIDTVGDLGDTITIYVDDPFLGVISIGAYTLGPSDTTVDIIADNVGDEINLNVYDYYATVVNNVITITAADGTGALINGNNNIYVTIITPGFLFTESGDNLITENNNNLITEQTYG